MPAKSTSQQIIEEWRQQEFGVLLVGGLVMVAAGLQEEAGDIDACIPARQCPRILEWLADEDRQHQCIDILPGSTPLHADWLGQGWTCHLRIGGIDRVGLTGIPLRASRRLADRFWADPPQVALASLVEVATLKRSGLHQDWADIDLIIGGLMERRDSDAVLMHLFGEPLVETLLWMRGQDVFRRALAGSQQAIERPILIAGLDAPLEELRAMARAEQRFWRVAGELCADHFKDILDGFWDRHSGAINAEKGFENRHAALLAAARADLPERPLEDPAELIEVARQESGADRWAGLLPDTEALVAQYFPQETMRLAG